MLSHTLKTTHDIRHDIKRGIDLTIASALLIILFPVMACIALAVVLDSPGGAFYRQKRVGKNGRLFFCYKFRTMHTGCDDAQYKQYLVDLIASERNGSGAKLPYRKMAGDCRVTRIGKFLRRYYLDELPQLVNIIKGEMSLVGPRPHVPLEVAHYLPEQRRRLDVLPGVTGLWQVKGRADCTFNQLIALDLQYIDQWSLGMDLAILYETVAVLFQGGEAKWKSIQSLVQPVRLEVRMIPNTGGEAAEKDAHEKKEAAQTFFSPQPSDLARNTQPPARTASKAH